MTIQRKRQIPYRGVTAIEVVIGVSIAALILVFTMYAIMLFVNAGRTVSEKTEAVYLAEEALELIRFVRDGAWSNISSLTNNTTYYLDITGGAITVTNTPEVIDGFRRSFIISNVYRNAVTNDIVASTTGGSVADSSSKYVTATVSWGVSTSTISLTSILTNLNP